MKIGVLDVQGDVAEHLAALYCSCKELGLNAKIENVKTVEAIESIDALIIPGGESTTVSMLCQRFGLDESIKKISSKIPLFGTCAGLVYLCSEGVSMKSGQKSLGLLDAKVIRNAFGRQKDSFEADITVKGFESEYPGVFIRAPAIEKVWGDCEILSTYNEKIVFVKQKNILACAFHPELTKDIRLHTYFLQMI